jgi:hypothetical protein
VHCWKAVAYCDEKCQKKHWKKRKAICEKQAENVKRLDATGTYTSKFGTVMSWYSGVPNLAEGVIPEASRKSSCILYGG